MLKLVGIVLIAAGVAGFWFGGIPYKQKETVVKIGTLEANATFDKTLEIPRPVSAGLIGLGVVFLLIPSGKKR